jgi:hypothetical protein
MYIQAKFACEGKLCETTKFIDNLAGGKQSEGCRKKAFLYLMPEII